MANEATIIELLGNGGDPIQYTVADGATIEKGTLGKLSDPRTAAASSANADICVGIAAADKVASDGSTKLAFYTNCIAELTVGGSAVTLGSRVMLSGANLICNAAAADVTLGKDFGVALETGSAAERIAVKVRA